MIDNEYIARKVAQHCFSVNDDDHSFALQLFVERLVLPSGMDSYSEDEMYEYVLDYLENNERK